MEVLLFMTLLSFISSQKDSCISVIEKIIKLPQGFDTLDSIYNHVEDLSSQGDKIAHILHGMMDYFGLTRDKNIISAILYQSIDDDCISMLSRSFQIHTGLHLKKSPIKSLLLQRNIYNELSKDNFLEFFNTNNFKSFSSSNNLPLQEAYFVEKHQFNYMYQFSINESLNKTYEWLNLIFHHDPLNIYEKEIERVISSLKSRHYEMYIAYKNLFKLKVIKKESNMYENLDEIIKESTKRADEGCHISAFNFALASYLINNYVSTEREIAFKYMELANDSNFPFARHFLGLFYYEGFGTEIDAKKAIIYLEKSILDGCVSSIGYLGYINDVGVGTINDPSLGYEFYSSYNLHLMGKYIRFHIVNSYIQKKYLQTLIYMTLMAFMGDKKQFYSIGVFLSSNLISKKAMPLDRQEILAFQFFELALHHGEKKAWAKLADCYYYGTGIKKNITDAYIAYQQAYFSGNEYGAINLAYMNLYGEGFEADYNHAKRLFEEVLVKIPQSYILVKYFLLRIKYTQKYKNILQEIDNFKQLSVTLQMKSILNILLALNRLQLIFIFYTSLCMAMLFLAYRYRY